MDCDFKQRGAYFNSNLSPNPLNLKPVIHVSYYIMTFLIISTKLLPMLMIILSTLGVIRHLICGNN